MRQLQQGTQPFLVLGTTGGKSLTLTGADFERHKWLLGISGSGKSTLLAWIALSLLRLGIAFCVIDPHGDLARLILSLLASSDFFKSKQAEKLWFIDFARSDRTIPFNVLKQTHIDNYKVADHLLQAIHRAFPTSTGTTSALDNTIEYASFVLAENGLPLTQLQRFLLDKAYRDTLLAKIRDQQIVQFFDFSFADKVSSQLIESTMRRLNLLTFSPTLRAALGHKDNKLNFRYLMDHQISCLISLGGLSDSEKRLAGCLLMTSLEQAFLSRASLAPDLRFPYHVIVDEFPLFSASGDSFSVILEQVRKYKGTLYLAHQTLSQLQKGMMGSLQNAIPIIMKAGTDDSSALVSRFYRPVQEKPAGFFDSLFGYHPPLSPFADAQNVTQARRIFETLERQEALVVIHHEIHRIVTPTMPIKEDRKLLERIEDMYAVRLLVPIAGNQAEETPVKPLLSLVSAAPTLARRSIAPASRTFTPLTLITGDLETDILSCLATFHYASLPQVATFLGRSEKNNNYLRKKITALTDSGLVDVTFLPRVSGGKPLQVFFLAAKGQKEAASRLPLAIPLSTGERKHQFLEHTLDVNEVLLAALKLLEHEGSLRLDDLKHERTLKASPLVVAPGRAVVPDGFVAFQTATNEVIGLLIEIDRNTENRERIVSKIDGLARLAHGSLYEKTFGLQSVTIAFIVTVGGENRVVTLCEWSQEVLKERELKNLFLFGAAPSFTPTLFTDPLFRTLDTASHALIEQPF